VPKSSKIPHNVTPQEIAGRALVPEYVSLNLLRAIDPLLVGGQIDDAAALAFEGCRIQNEARAAV
jgi:hypothetical protein